MKQKRVSKQTRKKIQRVYISNQDWKEIEQIGSGVNFYKGKKTFFYNGQPLRDDTGRLVYDDIERSTWQVIIILPGVVEIPPSAFYRCWHVKTVIMADTVKRVDD